MDLYDVSQSAACFVFRQRAAGVELSEWGAFEINDVDGDAFLERLQRVPGGNAKSPGEAFALRSPFSGTSSVIVRIDPHCVGD